MTFEGLSEITTTVCPDEWKAKESQAIRINSTLKEAMVFFQTVRRPLSGGPREVRDELDHLGAPLLCYSLSVFHGVFRMSEGRVRSEIDKEL